MSCLSEFSWQLSNILIDIGWPHLNSWSLTATKLCLHEGWPHSGEKSLGPLMKRKGAWLLGNFNCFFFPHVIDVFLEILYNYIVKSLWYPAQLQCVFRRGTLHSIFLLSFSTACEIGKPIHLAICCLNNVNVFGAGMIQIWCCGKVLTKFNSLSRLFWRVSRSSKRSCTSMLT